MQVNDNDLNYPHFSLRLEMNSVDLKCWLFNCFGFPWPFMGGFSKVNWSWVSNTYFCLCKFLPYRIGSSYLSVCLSTHTQHGSVIAIRPNIFALRSNIPFKVQNLSLGTNMKRPGWTRIPAFLWHKQLPFLAQAGLNSVSTSGGEALSCLYFFRFKHYWTLVLVFFKLISCDISVTQRSVCGN